MRTLGSLVAVVSLALTVASILVIGGVAFALLLFFPLFLLAWVTVLVSTGARTVRQHNPSMSPRGVARWRLST